MQSCVTWYELKQQAVCCGWILLYINMTVVAMLAETYERKMYVHGMNVHGIVYSRNSIIS